MKWKELKEAIEEVDKAVGAYMPKVNIKDDKQADLFLSVQVLKTFIPDESPIASVDGQGELYRWVKASERLPESSTGRYFIRWKHSLTEVGEWEVLWGGSNTMINPERFQIEWLSPVEEDNQNEATQKELEYWKQRCEAAEIMVNALDDFFKNHTGLYKEYNLWQTLKNKSV